MRNGFLVKSKLSIVTDSIFNADSSGVTSICYLCMVPALRALKGAAPTALFHCCEMSARDFAFGEPRDLTHSTETDSAE